MAPAACFRRPCWPWPPPGSRVCCPATFTASCCTAASCPSSGRAVRPPSIPPPVLWQTTPTPRPGWSETGCWSKAVPPCGRRWLVPSHLSGVGPEDLGGFAYRPGPPPELAGAASMRPTGPFRACGVASEAVAVPGLGGRRGRLCSSLHKGRAVWARGAVVLLQGQRVEPEGAVGVLALGCRPPGPVPCCSPSVWRRPSASFPQSAPARFQFAQRRPWASQRGCANGWRQWPGRVVANQDPLRSGADPPPWAGQRPGGDDVLSERG